MAEVFDRSDKLFKSIHPLSHIHSFRHSFYAVWDTHGAANKHGGIYGHIQAKSVCLCSFPQYADIIIKQETQVIRLLNPLTQCFSESMIMVSIHTWYIITCYFVTSNIYTSMWLLRSNVIFKV